MHVCRHFCRASPSSAPPYVQNPRPLPSLPLHNRPLCVVIPDYRPGNSHAHSLDAPSPAYTTRTGTCRLLLRHCPRPELEPPGSFPSPAHLLLGWGQFHHTHHPSPHPAVARAVAAALCAAASSNRHDGVLHGVLCGRRRAGPVAADDGRCGRRGAWWARTLSGCR